MLAIKITIKTSLVFDWESGVCICPVGVHFESLWSKTLPLSTPSNSQGWMNEIHNYDPEMYHATLTHSIYIRLEGSVLRLSKPNRNISRRATHNEPKPDVTYVSQKIYDLTDSKVCCLWLYAGNDNYKRDAVVISFGVCLWNIQRVMKGQNEWDINVLSACLCQLPSIFVCLMIRLTDSDIKHTSSQICPCLSACLLIGHVQWQSYSESHTVCKHGVNITGHWPCTHNFVSCE